MYLLTAFPPGSFPLNLFEGAHTKIMLLVSVVATTLVCSTQPQNSCTDTVSPPMGWNSYDMTIGNHGINSSFAIQAAHFIHDNLQPLGYNYITLDSGWFGTDSTYEGDGAGQTVDEYGRLVPNRTYYPDGFRPLKEVVEKLGLKWGFWIMGGIPRVAVQQKSKIKGTNFTADQVADLTNTTNCPWNKWLVYGSKRLADGSIHPGAAAYAPTAPTSTSVFLVNPRTLMRSVHPISVVSVR